MTNISNREKEIVWAVDRQRLGRHGEATEEWIEDYDSPETAIEQARADWDHLTREEQKNNVIYVYEDVIYHADEDSDEFETDERRSWYEGYTPIAAFSWEGK